MIAALGVVTLVGASSVGTPSKSRKGKTAKTGESTRARRSPATSSTTGKRLLNQKEARPARQSEPTRERYMEIQQALANKGYYAGPVDGSWGAPSAEPMRRFQADQNIPVDGKIGSLSLIALGLGPKRENIDAALLTPASSAPSVSPAQGSSPNESQ